MNNPYVFDRPVPGYAGFYNRVSELTRITSRIAAERPQSVSVVGNPRSGKTSTLNWLSDPLSRRSYLEAPDDYVCLILDLGAQRPTTPEAFFSLVSAALEANGVDGMAPSYDGFNDVVRELMRQERKLVVFCDDFHLVTAHEGFPLDFFSYLRSMANSNDVAYITTSPKPLQEVCHTKDIEESPFFNIFTTVNLSPFKAEAALELVEKPAEAAGAAFGGDAGWIAGLGGGSPYLLQLGANVAFDARLAGSLRQDKVVDSAFEVARPFLEGLWEDEFSEAKQEVLRMVYQDKAVERRLQYAADSLERDGHLCREGEVYRVASSLMGRFVKGKSQRGFLRRLFG